MKKFRELIGLVLCAVFAFTVNAWAGDRYVSTLGRDYIIVGGSANDCTNLRFAPCRSIQHAIDMADFFDVIKVASGTYGENIVIQDRKIVTIEGGWDEKFIARFPTPWFSTTISGLNQGSIFKLMAVGFGMGLTIDGFTLIDGNASQTGDERGGAIQGWARSEGLWSGSLSIKLNNNRISNNTGYLGGGAIFVAADAPGPGSTPNDAELTLTNNVIDNNAASSIGSGGAILAVIGSYSYLSIDLRDNIIDHNLSGGVGGGIAVFDSNDLQRLQMNLERNKITNNSAVDGGGIALLGQSSGSSELIMVNNLIADNENLTTGMGGGIYVVAQDGHSFTLTSTNDTITNNGNNGIVIYTPGTGTVTANITNGIVWGNYANINIWGNPGFGDLYFIGGGTVNARYSDIGAVYGPGIYNDGGGNINADPHFADSGKGNYHLKRASPAVDSGICGERNCTPQPFPHPPICLYGRIAPLYDFEGDPRPPNYRITGCDMGADEFFPSKIGVFRGGLWYLDMNGNGNWEGTAVDSRYSFGIAGDKPVVGNWNGTQGSVGLFRADKWYLDWNGNDVWEGPAVDRLYTFGLPGDLPVVGDWNGDGVDKIGVFRNGDWYLDFNGNGTWGILEGPAIDRKFTFGLPGDLPVVGDWKGDGSPKIGVFRNGVWYLDYNGNGRWDGPSVDRNYKFGLAGDLPAAGDWNGDGVDKIGVFRNGVWYLDLNGNGLWEGPSVDGKYSFGLTGDKPIAGKW